ncbi:hypothetical protein [Alicyclobacillus fructus]|uniref:hypothetical protein n=1 Tax=Alicyclobacillus fructus TaxID=2816082 RepID=UPI001A8D1A7E|nr:hypothetical protein [Alicyclobacillus fructus]
MADETQEMPTSRGDLINFLWSLLQHQFRPALDTHPHLVLELLALPERPDLKEKKFRPTSYHLPASLPLEAPRVFLDDAIAWIDAWNEIGYAVCVGPVPRARAPKQQHASQEEVVQETRVLWLDVDHLPPGGPDEMLAKLPISPNWIVRSGRGAHLYFLLSEPLPADVAKSAMVALAELVDGDHTQDIPRVLRIPGSLHWKSGEPVQTAFAVLRDEPYTADIFRSFAQGTAPQMSASGAREQKAKEPVEIAEDEVRAFVAQLPEPIQALILTGQDPEPGDREDLSRSADQYKVCEAVLDAGGTPDMAFTILSNASFGISARTREIGKKRLWQDVLRIAEKRAQKNAQNVFPASLGTNLAEIGELLDAWTQTTPWIVTRETEERARGCLAHVFEEIAHIASQRRVNAAAKTQAEQLRQLLDRLAVYLPFSTVRAVLRSVATSFDQPVLWQRLRNREWWEEIAHRKVRDGFLENWVSEERGDLLAWTRSEISAVRESTSSVCGEEYCQTFVLHVLQVLGDFFRLDVDARASIPENSVFFRPKGKPEAICALGSKEMDGLLRDLGMPDKWIASVKDVLLRRARGYRVVQGGRISRAVVSGDAVEAIYVDMGDGWLLKITPEGDPVRVPNGEDIYLQPSGVRPWQYTPGQRGALDELCEVHVDPESSKLSDEQAGFLLKAWFLGNLARGYSGARPLLHLVGPAGVGKSTLATRLFLGLLGDTPPANPPGDHREVTASCAQRGLLFLDNLESASGELVDILDRLVYSTKIGNREYYTNTGEIIVAPDVFVVITSISTRWVRDDLATRMLAVHLGERDWPRGYDASLQWTLAHRNAILSEAVDLLSVWLRHIQGKDRKQYGISHRLSPFAEFANSLAEACGIDIDTSALWQKTFVEQATMVGPVLEFVDALVAYLAQHEDAPGRAAAAPQKVAKLASEWGRALFLDGEPFGSRDSGSLATRIGTWFSKATPILEEKGIRVQKRRMPRGVEWEVDYSAWARTLSRIQPIPPEATVWLEEAIQKEKQAAEANNSK